MRKGVEYGPRKDLTGQRFGRLVVRRLVGRNEKRNYIWDCVCDCGEIKVVQGVALAQGWTMSCGCLHSELVKRPRTHGMAGTREHNIWEGMRNRCNNPNNKDYYHYGGRGIKYDLRWEDFAKFFEDMGSCPPGHTLDRIDNDKSYGPENCRWSSRKQQARNKRNVKSLTLDGVTRTVPEWADLLGISSSLINSRLSKGWTTEEALSPMKGRRK
jgi:hypothetical protein